MKDKAVDDIAALLAPRLRRVYPLELASERGLPARELGQRFEAPVTVGGESRAADCDVRYVSNVEAAIADFCSDPPAPLPGCVLLITGSHYLLEQLPVPPTTES